MQIVGPHTPIRHFLVSDCVVGRCGPLPVVGCTPHTLTGCRLMGSDARIVRGAGVRSSNAAPCCLQTPLR